MSALNRDFLLFYLELRHPIALISFVSPITSIFNKVVIFGLLFFYFKRFLDIFFELLIFFHYYYYYFLVYVVAVLVVWVYLYFFLNFSLTAIVGWIYIFCGAFFFLVNCLNKLTFENEWYMVWKPKIKFKTFCFMYIYLD